MTEAEVYELLKDVKVELTAAYLAIRSAWTYDDTANLGFAGYNVELGANECCYTYWVKFPDNRIAEWSTMEDKTNEFGKLISAYIAQQLHPESINLEERFKKLGLKSENSLYGDFS